jgi:hypothetical protein
MIIISVLIFILAMNFVQGQNFSNTVSFTKGKIEIPFTYYNGFIELNIKLHGFPIKFIYDTGAEHTILFEKEIATSLDLSIIKEVEVYGADFSNKISGFITTPVEIEIVESFIKYEPILILSEDIYSFSTSIGRNIYGIIGASFFKNLFVKIDYRNRKLILYPPDYKLAGKGYEEMPVEFTGYKPVLKSQIKISSIDEPLDVNILLDTGSSVPLILFKDVDSKFSLPDKTVRGYLGYSLGGDLLGWLGLVSEVKIGGFHFTGLICKFQDIDSVSLTKAGIGREGIAGNDILRRFSILIDNINKKLYFKPNKLYSKPVKFDKSGITLYAAGENLNEYYVKYVIEGSPADLAGVKPNDRIQSAQHINCNLWSLEGLANLFKKKENKKIRLKVVRDGQKLEYEFRLRDMFR